MNPSACVCLSCRCCVSVVHSCASKCRSTLCRNPPPHFYFCCINMSRNIGTTVINSHRNISYLGTRNRLIHYMSVGGDGGEGSLSVRASPALVVAHTDVCVDGTTLQICGFVVDIDIDTSLPSSTELTARKRSSETRRLRARENRTRADHTVQYHPSCGKVCFCGCFPSPLSLVFPIQLSCTH